MNYVGFGSFIQSLHGFGEGGYRFVFLARGYELAGFFDCLFVSVLFNEVSGAALYGLPHGLNGRFGCGHFGKVLCIKYKVLRMRSDCDSGSLAEVVEFINGMLMDSLFWSGRLRSVISTVLVIGIVRIITGGIAR